MADFDRVEREHFVGHGTQLLIADPSRIEASELDELPARTLALFEQWAELRGTVPSSLAWSSELLATREAVLERAAFDDRVYWSVRLARAGTLGELSRPCIGADGIARGTTDLPAPWSWLAALGRLDLVAEQSGSSSWGATLSDRRRQGMLPWTVSALDDGEDGFELPDGSDDWLELYEVDGDVVYADPEGGRVHWVGGEWSGDPITSFDLDWHATAHFILWRMLDGGFVRPTDLEMLVATR